MSKGRPVLLIDAIVALYAMDAAGGCLLDVPIWFGRCSQAYQWEETFPESDATRTGAPTREFLREPAQHRITLEHTWVLRPDGIDFIPHHRDSYAMVVTWEEQKTHQWFQRTFWHVETLSRAQATDGPLTLNQTLTFRARSYSDLSGFGSQSLTPQGAQHSVVSVLHESWSVGDFLLGFYRWPVPVRIRSARLHATADAVVQLWVEDDIGPITLEVAEGGLWTGDILVSVGRTLRWKVISLGPNPVAGAVVMEILPETEVVGASENPLQAQIIAWTEAESFSRIQSYYDERNVLDHAAVIWPDGVSGDLTVTQKGTTFPEVDAFHVTYLGGVGRQFLVSQAAVERNAFGDVTFKPRPTIAPS